MTDSITFLQVVKWIMVSLFHTSLELMVVHIDDRSISIDTGDMGKLTFSGSGSSGPIGAWDDVTPSANEEAHGVAVSGTAAGAANAASSDNIFHL